MNLISQATKRSYFSNLDCALLLLNHGAPVKAKNLKGWSSLAEAVSYGDRYLSEYLNSSSSVIRDTRL